MSDTGIDQLEAPEEDGAMLIWPDAASLITAPEKNRELRRGYRFELLGQAVQELIAPEPMLIATGHQPGFLHPGVWVKNVVSCEVAARLKGVPNFLIVDNDALQQSALKWPEIYHGFLRIRSVYPFRFPLEWPYEILPQSDSAQWSEFFANLPAGMRSDRGTLMLTFLEGFLGDGPDRTYAARWIDGMYAMESRLGTEIAAYTPVSEWFDVTKKNSAAHFFGHIAVHAAEFATCYNRALGRYRERRGIRGSQHPIPDLAVAESGVEIPFWGLHPDRRRERLSVQASQNRIVLSAGEQVIAEIELDALTGDPFGHLATRIGEWRIRPRALTLTMFTRLLCCDLFIHGIGGAKYDQVTDDCIRAFFGVEPPAYACVSATLRLDLPRYQVAEQDLIRVHGEQREMRYNPQRFLTDRFDGSVQTALNERDSAIAFAEQLRAAEPGNRSARKAAYDRISRTNVALSERIARDDGCCLEELRERLAHNKVADYREWFMGLHSSEKLKKLADTLLEHLGERRR